MHLCLFTDHTSHTEPADCLYVHVLKKNIRQHISRLPALNNTYYNDNRDKQSF